MNWPVNGMQICGGSFTLRGLVDDPSATVVASITDTNGDTNIVTGSVERSGVLWVQNLPLAEGTNLVTLWVTNAAGLLSMTNLMVVKSGMTMSLDWIDGDLWMPTVNAGGSVSDASYNVWVNGVEATNNGDGTWGATNVPVSASGVASFDISASSGGGDPDYSTNVLKDAAVEIVQHDCGKSGTSTDSGGNTYLSTGSKSYGAVYAQNGGGGWFLQSYMGESLYYNSSSAGGGSWDQTVSHWSSADRDTFYYHYTDSVSNDDYYPDDPIWLDTYGQLTGVPDEDLQEFGEGGEYGIPDGVPPRWVSHYYANNLDWIFPYPDGSKTEIKVDASTQQKLFIGGMAGVGHQNLIQLQCSAVAYGTPPGGWLHTPQTDVPSTRLQALGKNVGSDGKLWVVEPDGASPDLGLTAKGYQHYAAGATATKYTLKIQVNSSAFLSPLGVVAGANYSVGQKLTFSPYWLPGNPPYTESSSFFHWNLPGNFVNEPAFYPTYSLNDALLAYKTTSCWYLDEVDSGIASIGMNLQFPNGQNVSIAAIGKFQVDRPKISSLINNQSGFSPFPYELISLRGNMDWTAIINSKHDGYIGVTQLINGNTSPYYTGGADWLDGTEIYGEPAGSPYENSPKPYIVSSSSTHFTELEDHPYASVAPLCVTMNAHFKDYVRFKPDGDDSIFVTLGIVSWYMDGYACLPSSVTQDDLPPATGPVDSTAFPLWTNQY